jgi:hypothetical protein
MVLSRSPVPLEDVDIDTNLLGDVLDDPLGHFGNVGQSAARKSEQSEMNGEAQSVGWSTTTIDELQVAV